MSMAEIFRISVAFYVDLWDEMKIIWHLSYAILYF